VASISKARSRTVTASSTLPWQSRTTALAYHAEKLTGSSWMTESKAVSASCQRALGMRCHKRVRKSCKSSGFGAQFDRAQEITLTFCPVVVQKQGDVSH